MSIEESEKRMIDSRERMNNMMQRAIGIYMAKEVKIKDQWREQSYWQVFQHLKHEIEEIERSSTPNRKIHNLLDACGLCVLLANKVEMEVKQ